MHCRGFGSVGEEYQAMGRELRCVKPPRSIMRHPKLLTADTTENIQELLREGPTVPQRI